MSIKKFSIIEGATTPVYVPFNPNGCLDLDYILPYGNSLLKKGVKNLFVNGTTGEFCSLSVAERKSLLEAWHRNHGDKFDFIVHVGACGLTDTVELTEHAANMDSVKVIAVVSPYFIPPTCTDALVNYFQEVARVAKGLPLMYYHIPSLSHCTVPLEEFLEAALNKVHGFCSMKFTDNNLPLMERCQNLFGGRMQILCGLESMYFDAIHFGIQEGIFASYNFFVAPYHCLRRYATSLNSGVEVQNMEEVDTARDTIKRFFKSCEPFMTKIGMIPLLKDLGRLSGLVGVGTSRLPLQNLNDKDVNELRQSLLASCPEFFH